MHAIHDEAMDFLMQVRVGKKQREGRRQQALERHPVGLGTGTTPAKAYIPPGHNAQPELEGTCHEPGCDQSQRQKKKSTNRVIQTQQHCHRNKKKSQYEAAQQDLHGLAVVFEPSSGKHRVAVKVALCPDFGPC